MAFPKTNLFGPKHIELARFARALSHPARIALIEVLLEKGEMGTATCGELVAALPLAQPTVSQHLRCLREVGLLQPTSSGNSVAYALNREAMASFCHSFQATLGTEAQPSKPSKPSKPLAQSPIP
jgi:DNA-binding transcriptional ArsR family regulator